jgi:hypothetical protein
MRSINTLRIRNGMIKAQSRPAGPGRHVEHFRNTRWDKMLYIAS